MFLLFNARSGYFVTKMQFEECLREFAIRLDPNLILGLTLLWVARPEYLKGVIQA